MIIEIPDDDVPTIHWALTAARFTAHILATGPHSTTADQELGRRRRSAIDQLLGQLDAPATSTSLRQTRQNGHDPLG